MVHHAAGPAKRTGRVKTLCGTLAAQGHDLSVHDSSTFRFAEDAPLAGLICICGGDGTVRMVLDRQADISQLPPLAIYPLGTINLLARELGYPRQPEAFARRIARTGNRCTARLAKAGEATFIACASAGTDALVVSTVSLRLKALIGRLAYGVALFGLLARWPRVKMRLSADDSEFDAEAVFVLRGKYYAGPWMLDRQAGLGRDCLRVLALPQARRRDIAGLMFHALTGARRPNARWRIFDTAQLQVRIAEPAPVQADGDVIATLPLDFRIGEEAVTWK
ncbi:MAG: diacylglycerol kinase family protein [Novosphingobium sp.]